MELTSGLFSKQMANGCRLFTCSVNAAFLVSDGRTLWLTQLLLKRQVFQISGQSSVTGGWLSSDTWDVCQKGHQRIMPSKHLLNCPLAPTTSHGEESLEDHETACYVVFSRTYSSSRKRTGQWLTIVRHGERNGPPSTTRSDHDEELKMAPAA